VNKLSWEVYNCLYTTDKSDSMFFRRQNRFLNSIIEELNLYERMELIRTLIALEKRRVEMGMQPYKCGSSFYILQSSSGAVEVPSDGASGGDVSGTLADSHQSANVTNPASAEFETTVRYIDEEPGIGVKFNNITDQSFYKDYVPDSDIIKFLQRPKQIATITWLEGTPFNTTLAPWDLYFNTTSVKNKIENYAWLSCNLKVKVLINSSPFYYGAALMSYYPNLTLTAVGTSGGANVAEGICTRSQRPHIWIYPQCNQGGEFCLPFLYHNNWLPVGSRTAFQNMGTLLVESAVDLGSANAAVGVGVTISIYAWAENVKLAGPTRQAALQGEFGLISTPASAVANVARSLTQVSFLRPYAKATELAATAIGNIAKIFGFSNTAVITDVQPFKNLPFHSFASGEISQPTERLTIDPKQELCVDSRVCGYEGKDELIIADFCARETFICYAPWSTSDAAGTLLAKSNVSPKMGRVGSVLTTSYHNSPMGHVANMFRYWRGDIIYTFRFIASKYHRGRALIQYDPYADIITNATDTNIVYSQVVDIAENAEVEFRVPYMGQRPFKETQTASTSANYLVSNFLEASGTLVSYSDRAHNGRLTIRVLNVLTAPVATANIVVMCSVRGAENLEFAAPIDIFRDSNFYTLQSEVVEYKSANLSSASDKVNTDGDNDYLVNMGEKIVSLRQILRRSTLSRVGFYQPQTTNQVQYIGSVFSPIPLYRGWDANGINSATNSVPATAPYNFVHVTPINWIMPCFIGYRGSMNWHINVNSGRFVDTVTVYRWGQTQIATDYALSAGIATGLSNSALASNAQSNTHNMFTGTQLSNQRTQSGISVNVPFYSSYRMRSTSVLTNTLGTIADDSSFERVVFKAVLKPSVNAETTVASTSVEYYCSIGHDFDLIFFINVPVIHFQTTPAAV
jgi:hypothetical protein